MRCQFGLSCEDVAEAWSKEDDHAQDDEDSHYPPDYFGDFLGATVKKETHRNDDSIIYHESI